MSHVGEINTADVELAASEPTKRRYKVALSGERLRTIESKWFDLAHANAQLPGFRRGHVPREVMMNQMGSWLEGKIVHEVLESVVSDIVKKDNLKLVSNAVVDKVDYKMNDKVTFEVDFAIEPVFQVKDYLGLPIKRYDRPIKEEDVEAEFTRVLSGEDPSYLVPVEPATPAVREFWALANIKFYENSNSNASKEPLWQVAESLVYLSEECLPFGVREAVLGMKSGETKKVDFSWDEDCPVADLRGKKGHIEIEVLALKRLIKLQTQQNHGVKLDEARLKELRGKVREALGQRLEQRARSLMKDQLTAVLLEANPIEVAQAEVEAKTSSLTDQARAILAMSQRGLSPEHEAELRIKYRIEAANDVRLYYILREIAKRENVKITEEDVKKRLEAVRSDEEKEYLIRHREETLQGVLADKVFDFLISKANIEVVEV